MDKPVLNAFYFYLNVYPPSHAHLSYYAIRQYKYGVGGQAEHNNLTLKMTKNKLNQFTFIVTFFTLKFLCDSIFLCAQFICLNVDLGDVLLYACDLYAVTIMSGL